MPASLTEAPAKLGCVRCPRCHDRLEPFGATLHCSSPRCESQFPVVDGIPVLINEENSVFVLSDFTGKRNTTFDLNRGKLTEWVDRHLPSLSNNIASERNYRLLTQLLLKSTPQPKVLVIGGSILGQGMEPLAAEPRVTLMETDVSFGPRTKVICDAHDLPFADATFDAVVVQGVLQYVRNPIRCVEEMRRVLKPGGFIYTETAFIQQVVHGRHDYHRFTHLGLRGLFREFSEIESGIVGGPGMALAWSVQFFLLSAVKSRFMRRIAYLLSRVSLFWLKYFDQLSVKNPGAYDTASGFYFLGHHRGKTLSDRDLITLYRGAQ